MRSELGRCYLFEHAFKRALSVGASADPEQLEAYFVRNGLPVVYSSKSSIVFDRSGQFDGKLYLSCGGDVEKSTASQGDRRRRRLTPHEGHRSSAQRPFDSANMYDDSCLPVP